MTVSIVKLDYETSVAEGIKAVFVFNRLPVGLSH